MIPRFSNFLPFVAVFASAGMLSAQTVQLNRDLEAFSRVEVSGSFLVEMHEGQDYSVSITVDEMLQNYVQAYVEGGKLKVYLDEKKLSPDVRRHYRSRMSDEPVLRAGITVPPVIRSLSMNGNTVLESISGNVFSSDSARFFLSGESRIADMSLKGSDNVQIRLDRRSSADVSVECSGFHAELNGSSNAEFNAECSEGSVVMTANSSCVWNGKTDDLKVHARGTSRSILNGESASAEYVVAGSADINAENLEVVDAKVDMTGFCSLTQSASGSLFLEMSNGARLVYKNSPVFFISSVKNSSILRYFDDPTNSYDDSNRRTL